MNNLINDLRLEAEMKIEEIKEQIAQVDWAQVLRTVIVAVITFFKTDWAPYIEVVTRRVIKVAVWVYVAGYFLGTAIHATNDVLSQFAIRLLADGEMELVHP